MSTNYVLTHLPCVRVATGVDTAAFRTTVFLRGRSTTPESKLSAYLIIDHNLRVSCETEDRQSVATGHKVRDIMIQMYLEE